MRWHQPVQIAAAVLCLPLPHGCSTLHARSVCHSKLLISFPDLDDDADPHVHCPPCPPLPQSLDPHSLAPSQRNGVCRRLHERVAVVSAREAAVAERFKQFRTEADDFKRQRDADVKKQQSELEAHRQARLAELSTKAAELVSHTVPVKPYSCCVHGPRAHLVELLL